MSVNMMFNLKERLSNVYSLGIQYIHKKYKVPCIHYKVHKGDQ